MDQGPGNGIGDNVQIVLAKTAASDAYLTNLPLLRTGERKLEMLIDGVDDKHVRVQFEPSLLVD